MRLLFVLDGVEAPASVNLQLGQRLAAELAGRGHEVHLLELWDGIHAPPAAPSVRQHRLAFTDEYWMNTALENGSRQGSPLPLRLARLAAHPTAVRAAFRQLALHRPRRVTAARREIERLDGQFRFDAVCAVCAPYQGAFALEGARLPGLKLLWQMDPYAANRSYAAPGGYERERRLLDAVDGSFIEASAQPDYEDGAPLAACRPKVRVLGLPALVPAAEHAAPPHEGLWCTFCGTMASGVREPDFALALFAALDAPALTVTLAGPGIDRFDTAAARAVLGSRLALPGPVPVDRGRALQAEADILLNLGNLVDNQIPSKVYEYMGSGKPILHLAASRGDLCRPLLADYPLALVLPAWEGTGPAVQARLSAWLAEVRGKRLPYEEVAALFPRCTPAQAADDFLAGVQAFGSKR